MTTKTTTSNATDDAPNKGMMAKGGAKTFSGRPNPINIAYEKKTGELDVRITTTKAKLDDLFAGGVGKNLSNAEKEARSSLIEDVKAAREIMRKLIDEKKRLFEQQNDLVETLKKRSGQVQEAKDKLPFRTIPEMEARVQQIEAQIETGQYKLVEERQLLAEISKLKKLRRELESIDGSSNDVSSIRLRIDKIRTQVGEKDDAINAVKARINEINKKIDEMNGARAEASSARQDRSVAIDRLKKELDQLYQERRTSYEEYRTAKKAQFEAREKRDARRVEYERRATLEEKLEDLEEKLLAFNSETATDKKINECNNIRAFFSELLSSSTTAGNANNNEEVATAKITKGLRQVKLSAELADAEVIKKEDECFIVPKKKSVSSSTPPTANKVNTTSNNPSTQSLGKRMPYHIISALADLALPIPSTSADIPKLFEVIDTKMTTFTSKQDDALVEVEKKRQALIDQISDLKKELEKPVKVTNETIQQQREEAATNSNVVDK